MHILERDQDAVMRRLLFKGSWVIGAVVLAGALAYTFLGVRETWRTAQKNDIYATVFRYWSEHESPRSLSKKTADMYISVDGKDPDEELLRYLRVSTLAIKKDSEWTNPPGAGVRIGLGNLTWDGCSAVTVSVVDNSTWNYIAGQQYRVLRRGSVWEVASVTPFHYEVFRAPLKPDRPR